MERAASPMPSCPASPPSSWVRRWSHLVPRGGRVLDVACGSGRHLYWFHGRGHHVTGVDRAPEAIAATAPLARAGARIVQADIEAGPWPFAGEVFDAVVVTHYLWRPLFPVLLASVAPGGVLIYETFAHGQASVGRPARPEFLLQPGELLDLCRPTLRVVAYEDGFLHAPARFVQRVVAVREDGGDPGAPPRHPLEALPPAPAAG
jgi:SAM-dependent methyltransferase